MKLTPLQEYRLDLAGKWLRRAGFAIFFAFVVFCFWMAAKCETDLRYCLNPIACQVWK